MHTFFANGLPSPNKVEAYTQARQLQQRIRRTGEEMAALDGSPADLDPAPDAVSIRGKRLSTLTNASGTANFRDGKLVGLNLETDQNNLCLRELKSGFMGYHSKSLLVAESPAYLSVQLKNEAAHHFIPVSPNPSRLEAHNRLFHDIYSPDEMDAYKQARQLQEQVRQAGKEMAALNGQPGDLDFAQNVVQIHKRSLPSMPEASGSARFKNGQLTSLNLQGKHGELQLRKLNSGATAYIGQQLTVVETRDGDLRLEDRTNLNVEDALELMRPQGLGKSIAQGLRHAILGAVCAAGGAIPGVGALVNSLFTKTARPQSAGLAITGRLGTRANVAGSVLMGIGILSSGLTPGSVPSAVLLGGACLGLSALFAVLSYTEMVDPPLLSTWSILAGDHLGPAGAPKNDSRPEHR